VIVSNSSSSFQTTSWTKVLAAQGNSSEACKAMRELCVVYYKPVEKFIQQYKSRCDRHGLNESSDLTQMFFAKLLEANSIDNANRDHGHFRTYLLGAVKHFLWDERARANAIKRGGGLSPTSLNAGARESSAEDSESTYEIPDPNGFPPDAYFDKQWALSIVELAMKQLEEDARSQNDWDRFSVLQRWLATPNAETSTSQDASSIGMTESTFRVAVHRLRKQFRRIITEHIATTVEGPERVAEELDYLIRALSA